MRNKHIVKLFAFLLLSGACGLLGLRIGLNIRQSVSVSIFLASVLGTLFFWDLRLSFAFLGTSLLLATRTIDLENLIKFASLEVILFLIGMMVLMGFLKESGFFAWLISLILRTKNLTASKFLIYSTVVSALLACVVDEVTSIIFMTAAILEVCDYFEVNPIPFIIASVLTTNIGSAGTVLGNPIGILIASKSGLTFEDFIIRAFPLMSVCLLVAILLIFLWYRRALKELDRSIKVFGVNDILARLISVPPDRKLKNALLIFGLTLFFIGLHHRAEVLLGLEPNTILLMVPLVSSGLVMIWKREKARGYIEKDVDWWTLLFFLLLFAQAGTLKFTGATDVFSQKLAAAVGHNPVDINGAILWISVVGSCMLDNVVLVAAMIPILQSFQTLGLGGQNLWWALLFGGCLGGNITMLGSTANIVALGILEKEKNIRINFFNWLGIGLVVGLATTAVAWAFLSFVK